ncbi:MAG: hypothetical protein HYY52_04335 [Candidatus Melainabacteria bacterium]|nr:hypothetical protein [Candidatus Melainabacteria bacterium]
MILLRFVNFLLVLSFLLVSSYCGLEATSKTLLKGGISTVIDKGQIIDISLNTPINFYFSQQGDKISAILKDDILIGKDFYIPKGSRLDGIITEIKSPRYFGQDGAFEIEFNEIITPGNIRIPIFASVSTNTLPITKKLADTLTYDAALTTYGTFHGLIAGLQYGGLPLAFATHGISVLAGGGIGASAGIVGSMRRKGKIPTLLTGINTKVVLKSNLYILGELPVQEAEKQRNREAESYKGFRFFPKTNKDEINITIKNINKMHSKKYGDYIILNFELKNNSQNPISLSDIVLVNNSEVEPLHPDLFLSGQEALKTIKPFNEATISLAFLIMDKVGNYSLALVDPLDNEEILRVPLKEK